MYTQWVYLLNDLRPILQKKIWEFEYFHNTFFTFFISLFQVLTFVRQLKESLISEFHLVFDCQKLKVHFEIYF